MEKQPENEKDEKDEKDVNVSKNIEHLTPPKKTDKRYRFRDDDVGKAVSAACTVHLSQKTPFVAYDIAEQFVACDRCIAEEDLDHSQRKMNSDETTKLNCIITGAGGFIGQALASALLADPLVSKLTLTDVFKPAVPQTKTPSRVETRCLDADLTSLETCQSLFTPNFNLIYLLHGIMSGAAEANLELGLQVNIDSTRRILDILRRTNSGVKVVYPSSLAVYGPPATPTTKITELNTPVPGSSYGAQKHIIETLIDDYSRRDLLDGRVCRLPTITVRPGKPTGAASSFASGIFREPLKGEQSILPVSKDLEIWICSPRTVVKNLILARDIPKEKFPGTRIVNLPGVTVTVREMLDALKAVGGDEALKLVEEKRDDATEKIVLSWPTRVDISRAKMLGFAEDGTLTNTLQEYMDDYGGKTS